MAATLPIEKLRRYVALLNPAEPITEADDPRYVALDDGDEPVRGSDGSVIEQIRYNIVIQQPEGATCQLFTGFPGSGKTTELHRLGRSLGAQSGDAGHVVVIDAMSYLDRYSPLTITDVLRVLAYHLDREATRVEGGDPDRASGYLQRLWTWLQTDVEIRSIGFEAYGSKLMAEIRDNPTFRQKAEAIFQLRFQEFAREAHGVIAEAIARMRGALGVTRIVVLVDSLEKISAVRPEDRPRIEDSVEAVFTSHARWLRIPCHAVYTFPFWLRFRTTSLPVLFDGPPLALPMVKIRDRTGSLYEPGVRRMIDMIARRIDDPTSLFGDDWRTQVLPLVLASGGYPRDLLRMVRDAITRASSRTFPLTEAQIERVIDLVAEEYGMAALQADADLLAYIAVHHALPQGEASTRAASKLFELWQALTYRNGEEWYDLHPMVRRARAVQEALKRLNAQP